MAAASGTPVSRNAVDACAEIGVDISGARAHFAFDYDPNQFERFYCMSEQHAMMLNQCLNIPLEKITVMNVSDPFGGDLEVYRRCRDEIYRFVSKVADGYAD